MGRTKLQTLLSPLRYSVQDSVRRRELRQAQATIRELTTALEAATEIMEALSQALLTTSRGARDVAYSWLLSHEQPELDVREDIDGILAALNDHIALLEEQIVP
jgi:hypothetical protein